MNGYNKLEGSHINNCVPQGIRKRISEPKCTIQKKIEIRWTVMKLKNERIKRIREMGLFL